MAHDQDDQNALLQSILDRLTVLETQAPLESSSIGSGGIRVYDGGSIEFDGGNTAGDITIGVVGGQTQIRMGESVLFAGKDGSGNNYVQLRQTDDNGNVTANLMLTPAGASLVYGSSDITFSPFSARFRFGSHGLVLSAGGYQLLNVPDGTPAKTLGVSSDGTIVKFTGGGGTGPHPTGTWVWPFPLSATTSEFEPRWGRFHEGIDLGNAPALNGAAIHSAGPGTVQTAGYHSDDGFGYWVVVNHGDWAVNGTTYTVRTVYGHLLQSPSVTAGQAVTSDTVLGLVGNTGGSFGAHLHFETHLCAAGGGGIIWRNGDPSWDTDRTANNPRTVMSGLSASGG